MSESCQFQEETEETDGSILTFPLNASVCRAPVGPVCTSASALLLRPVWETFRRFEFNQTEQGGLICLASVQLRNANYAKFMRSQKRAVLSVRHLWPY